MKLRFRARFNISRATFRPEALNSTSIGGFFVHRDFENVEQYQQHLPVEEARRRVAPQPPGPTQKRPKEKELGTAAGGADKEEKGGEGGSGVGGKVEEKKIGKEKKKKGEGKKNEPRKGPKEAEGAIGGEEIKGEAKNGEIGVAKMGKGEGKKKKKAKMYDAGKEMRKEGEVVGKKGKVSGERDEGVEVSVGRKGASGEGFTEAANPMFAKVADKKGKEGSKGAVAKVKPKSTKKDKGGISEAGNSLFATMGDKKGKDNKKGAAPAKPTKDKEFSEAGNPLFATMVDKKGKDSKKGTAPAKPTKDKEFSEAGNPLFATIGDKKAKENSKGAVAKTPSKPAKKEEGKRMFMKNKKDVEEPLKLEVVAPKPSKLPPADRNAPSARNPLLQYKERPNSGQLQVKTGLQESNDADSGDEFDA